MDRFKDKFNAKEPKANRSRPEEEPEALAELSFQDETAESWDFQASASGGGARFTYSKRESGLDNYRVLGGKTGLVRRVQAQTNRPSAAIARPNRFNSSVKMVAADAGPAPWDWENVNYLKMPVVGEVAAGRYDVTVAYNEPGYGPDADFVLVNPAEVKVGRDTFALRVRGQSMVDNEIENGDIIIVQAQDYAEDGDFVLACLTDSTDPNGFVTLKRFYRHRQGDRVVLQPANQSLSPIHILPRKGDPRQEDLDGVKIQGRVIAIIKTSGLV